MSLPIWDDKSWPALPTLQGDVRAAVCVVGLGGSGLACVKELLSRGVDVVGVEAGEIAGGAAGRNGGFLIAGAAAFHHDAARELGREKAATLYNATLSELDRMEAETPDLIRRPGSMRIAIDDAELRDCEAQRAAMQRDGLAVESYDGPEGRGLLFPGDGVFNPLTRCRRLATQAVAAGARLFERSPAIEISGDEVRTSKGRVSCGRTIVAVDGGLAELLPELAGRVRTARLQMLATAPTTEVNLPRPVYARYGYEYWQQLPSGSIALGGFRDHGGKDEWTTGNSPSRRVQARLTEFLRQRIGVSAAITHRWAASVGYSKGVLPLVTECRPNLWAVGGYNGTGNLVGALCGRLSAKLALGEDDSLARLLLDQDSADRSTARHLTAPPQVAHLDTVGDVDR